MKLLKDSFIDSLEQILKSQRIKKDILYELAKERRKAISQLRRDISKHIKDSFKYSDWRK